MNILGANRSEMADLHPRDSAYPNVGHTSRQDPWGNRPSSQDRLRDSRNVRDIRDMSSVKKVSPRRPFDESRVGNLFHHAQLQTDTSSLLGSLFNRIIIRRPIKTTFTLNLSSL